MPLEPGSTAPAPAGPAIEQAAIVRAIESGAALEASKPLARIDTHMSHVFLDEHRAYKLLRALTHPFADLSSLSARETACRRALDVNHAFAPELYEDVLPVVRRADGDVKIGDEISGGHIVDWVVTMRRFPPGALLDEIARGGTLRRRHVLDAVDITARVHLARPPLRNLGGVEDYLAIVAGLRQTEAGGAARIGATVRSARFFERLEAALRGRAGLIAERRDAGWVRHGHGDLHLRNICVFEGRVTPFDALEFAPALAISDVLYDIAFLLMDLRARGLDQLAAPAMHRYWDVAGQDEAALALLPPFMALRAAVRMAVAMEAGTPGESERYRRLGEALLESFDPATATSA